MSCQPVFIKSAVTSRVKPCYPFLRKASYLFQIQHFKIILNVQGAKDIDEEEQKVRETNGDYCNMLLKNNIEGIIIKWGYQVGICKIQIIFYYFLSPRLRKY